MGMERRLRHHLRSHRRSRRKASLRPRPVASRRLFASVSCVSMVDRHLAGVKCPVHSRAKAVHRCYGPCMPVPGEACPPVTWSAGVAAAAVPAPGPSPSPLPMRSKNRIPPRSVAIGACLPSGLGARLRVDPNRGTNVVEPVHERQELRRRETAGRRIPLHAAGGAVAEQVDGRRAAARCCEAVATERAWTAAASVPAPVASGSGATARFASSIQRPATTLPPTTVPATRFTVSDRLA